jgi:hypothetical protein
MPVIGKPFQRVAVDIIGPLPKSQKGNRFALVMIDLATKYPDAIALKRIDSKTIAEALLEMFCRIGLPSEILHDQGTQFMSSVMKRFNQLLQIKSINTTPYNPKCNGTCENFNKTLKGMLKKICSEEPAIWDRYLQPLLFAYREVPQKTTGFSPFELLFGFEVRGPLFLIKQNFLDDSSESEDVSVTEYVVAMRERLKEFMRLSNENESLNKTKEKVYYDKTSRARKFRVGEKVLLLLPSSTSKLLSEWKGPFEVVRRINKVDYVIRVNEVERTYHVNMLKIFREREAKPVLQSIPACSVQNADDIVPSDFKISKDLEKSEHHSIIEVLKDNEKCFDDLPGRVNFMKYELVIPESVKPTRSVPYRIPFHLKEKVDAEIRKWLKCGIIKKSTSQWASPVVIVQNSDASLRLTVDYRKVNNLINTDNFPMPNAESVIETLHEAKFISKLDLTKAFLQIPLTESSTKYTSFVIDNGQYEFNVVPFGIKFATGLCNRVINEILQDCRSFVANFVDDLVVYSSNFKDHLYHVNLVLKKLYEAGLTLNRSKCSFANAEVKFLGVVVGRGKMRVDEEKLEAVRNFPRPIVKKDMRSFLGLINFYRKFAPNLATYASPLNDTLRKCCPDRIVWTKELQTCFSNSVSCLEGNIPLYIPTPGATFVVQTDASTLGLGAVLWQRCDGEDKPISCISRKLKDAEKNYAIIELECLAIKWAIEKFHDYLYGSKFIVRTDHAPLMWLNENKCLTSRRMRWALSLQNYSFDIEYVKGKENFLADVFSRYPSSGENSA